MDFPGRGGLENVGLPPGLQAFSSTFSDGGVNDVYLNGYDKTLAPMGGSRDEIVRAARARWGVRWEQKLEAARGRASAAD
jgi:hypothetical protein